MKLGIILTPDARSKAYLQKILKNQITINEIIFMNDDHSEKTYSEEEKNESIRFLGNIISEMKQNNLRYHWAKAEEDYPVHYFIREINEGSLN